MNRSKFLASAALVLTLGAATLSPAEAQTPAAGPRTAAAGASPQVTVDKFPTTVTYGEKKTVTGKLTGRGKGHKVVMLQWKLPGGPWQTLSHDRSNSHGKYSLKLPAKFYHPGLPHRVAVKKGDSSKTRSVKVLPDYTPVAPKSAWKRIDSRYVFQYNPCKTIPYRVNLNGEPASALDDTKMAVHRLEIASGLRFKYLGGTHTVPWSQDAYPKDATLVIAWATDAETNRSFDNASAWGGTLKSVWAKSPKYGKVAQSTRTGIVIDKNNPYITPGSESSSSDWGYSLSQVQLIQHELGHTAGLGHVLSDHGQIMSYDASYNWGAGDLTGLAKFGKASGCLKPYYSRTSAGFTPTALPPVTAVP